MTGSGRYLDDITFPGLLHMGVVRSPHAHARITKISTDGALALSGVVAALGAKDLPEVGRSIPLYKAQHQEFRAFDQPVLSTGVVRYVGEPVLVVVADDPARLADALDAVVVDYDPLPPAASIEAALAAARRCTRIRPTTSLSFPVPRSAT